MTAVSVKAPLTPKTDHTPHLVTLKVFWKSTKQWTAADIADFQKSVPALAEKIKAEKYWNKDGDIKTSKFTCEDFAIRILAQYASSKGLPVKLKTGVRVYRNMELYDAAEHDKYSSTMYGFGDMVMLTYGAKDMQNQNTVPIKDVNNLLPGDILAQTKDNAGAAHHIQIVYSANNYQIDIYQGNSGTGNWASKIYRIFRLNPADPMDISYTGLPIEIGYYRKAPSGGWDYINKTVNSKKKDYLKIFEFCRWNFQEFNR